MSYWQQARAEQARAPENDLVRRHLWLAVRLAHQVRPPGLDDDERLAVANLMLCEAAHEWPTSKAKQDGKPFVWYASFRIKQGLLMEAARARLMPIPVKTRRAMRLAVRTAGRLAEAMDRAPTDEEVAAELGWPVEKVRWLRQLASAPEPLSLDAIVPGDDSGEDTYVDILPDPDTDVEGEAIEKVQGEIDRAWLLQALDELPPLMRATLSLRLGIPVPSAATLTVDEVLRVAANAGSATWRAVDKLREAVPAHVGAGRAHQGLVSGDGGPSFDFGRAPDGITSPQRRSRAADLWRRLADSEWAPPALAAQHQ